MRWINLITFTDKFKEMAREIDDLVQMEVRYKGRTARVGLDPRFLDEFADVAREKVMEAIYSVIDNKR